MFTCIHIKDRKNNWRKNGFNFYKAVNKTKYINYTLANKNKNTPNISAPRPEAFLSGKKKKKKITHQQFKTFFKDIINKMPRQLKYHKKI